MLLSAWSQRPNWFAGFLVFALATDAVDGTIARRQGQASQVGARLDSIADAAVYLTAPVAALVLYPVLREREALTVIVVIVAYVMPIAIGFIKFRRLTAYHTVAARTSGVLLGVAFLTFVALGVTWPLRIAAVVLVLSAIEEIAMTALLADWRANVPSLAHAVRLKQDGTAPGG